MHVAYPLRLFYTFQFLTTISQTFQAITTESHKYLATHSALQVAPPTHPSDFLSPLIAQQSTTPAFYSSRLTSLFDSFLTPAIPLRCLVTDPILRFSHLF
jgi:hypothetical protein